MKSWESLFLDRYRAHTSYAEACETIVSELEVQDPHCLQALKDRRILPGGRVFANIKATPDKRQLANCFAFDVEDSREAWAEHIARVTLLTLYGGGVGSDYSKLRPNGTPCASVAGQSAGGPCSLIRAVDVAVAELRSCRRGALLAQLAWDHPDIEEFMTLKQTPGMLTRTNISVKYDARWHDIMDAGPRHAEFAKAWNVFTKNVELAVTRAEPGFSFNGRKYNPWGELCNPCAEARGPTSGLSCNIGTLYLYNTLRAHPHVPSFMKQAKRDITALVELLLRCNKYGVVKDPLAARVKLEENRLLVGYGGIFMLNAVLGRPMLKEVLGELSTFVRSEADRQADLLGVARPWAVLGCAPNGTGALIAETLGGIEPPFAEAYLRKIASQTGFGKPKVHVMVDPGFKRVFDDYGIRMPTSYSLGLTDRLDWQATIQDFCDMGISSTINLPARGEAGNDMSAEDIAQMILPYHRRLAGLTFYPSAAIAEQPLTPITMEEAIKYGGDGNIIEDNETLAEITSLLCKSGVCGQ